MGWRSSSRNATHSMARRYWGRVIAPEANWAARAPSRLSGESDGDGDGDGTVEGAEPGAAGGEGERKRRSKDERAGGQGAGDDGSEEGSGENSDEGACADGGGTRNQDTITPIIKASRMTSTATTIFMHLRQPASSWSGAGDRVLSPTLPEQIASAAPNGGGRRSKARKGERL